VSNNLIIIKVFEFSCAQSADSSRNTALFYAAEGGHLPCVALLMVSYMYKLEIYDYGSNIVLGLIPALATCCQDAVCSSLGLNKIHFLYHSL